MTSLQLSPGSRFMIGMDSGKSLPIMEWQCRPDRPPGQPLTSGPARVIEIRKMTRRSRVMAVR